MLSNIATAEEVWVPDVYTGLDDVEVSSTGRVRRRRGRGRVRDANGNLAPYCPAREVPPFRVGMHTIKVTIRRPGTHYRGDYEVGKLVCAAFHGLPADPASVVQYMNNDRTDNRATNLRWVHALYADGEGQDGLGPDRRPAVREDETVLIELARSGLSEREIANTVGSSYLKVKRILKGARASCAPPSSVYGGEL